MRRRPLLNDQHARRFLWPIARPSARWALSRGALHNFVVGRHRFIDDRLPSSAARQFVIVGAGYDARPWRMPELGTWFVVDHPATLKRRRRLGDASDGRPVPIDLSQQPLAPALEAAGHDPDRPTAWIWEGVSMYLPQEAVAATLQGLAARSTPDSSLFADFWHHQDGARLRDGAHRAATSALQLLGEPIRYGVHPGDAAAVLASHGWSLTDHGTPRALAAHFGRRFDPAMHVVAAHRSL